MKESMALSARRKQRIEHVDHGTKLWLHEAFHQTLNQVLYAARQSLLKPLQRKPIYIN